MRTCAWCQRAPKAPVEIGGRLFCGVDTHRGVNSDCYRVVFLHKPINGLIWSWLDGWVSPVTDPRPQRPLYNSIGAS